MEKKEGKKSKAYIVVVDDVMTVGTVFCRIAVPHHLVRVMLTRCTLDFGCNAVTINQPRSSARKSINLVKTVSS